MEHSLFVGIDVAKDHLDVHIRPTGEAFRVRGDDAGLATLLAQVRPLQPTVLVLEATGGYEGTVVATLAGAGLPVAIVNPRQIRDFARATGQLAKTDTLDARIIALFAEAVRPAARPVPDEQARALGELVARRRQLVDMLGAELNRRRLLRDPRLQRHLDAHIAWLEEALRRLDDDLSTSSAPRPRGGPRKTCSAPFPGSDRSPLGP
jgi:transposase